MRRTFILICTGQITVIEDSLPAGKKQAMEFEKSEAYMEWFLK